MTAPELKPCPFCGGEASISKDHDPDGNGAFYAVKCRKCRAKSPEIYAVETCSIHFAQVRDAWNRRADLAQPAHVLVKPLVWSDRFGPNSECSYDHITADSALGLYRVEWKGWKDFDPPTVCCGGAFIGCYNTIQSAKSAAQADYEARILAALEPQPDPRDEVIKGLVEALEQFLIEYDEVDLAVHEPKSLTDAVYEARAALAAAKAVQP